MKFVRSSVHALLLCFIFQIGCAASPTEQVSDLLRKAVAEQSNGHLSAARRLYEEAAKASDPASAEYADCLNNLATVIYAATDYESARRYFEQAIQAYEKLKTPSNHYPEALSNYADLLTASGATTKAESIYKKALSILEGESPRRELEIANVQRSLACGLADRGESEQAIALLKQALAVQENKLGGESLDLADTLNNIGVLCLDMSDFDSAEKFLTQAHRIYLKHAIEEHIDCASVLLNLGDLYLARGDKKAALDYYGRSAKAVNHYFSNVLPAMSVAEQQAELLNKSNEQLARLLSVTSNEDASRSYDLICNWKGALIAGLERESRHQREATTPEQKQYLQKLQSVRAKLAALYWRIGELSFKDWTDENNRLSFEKEQLERNVAADYGADRAVSVDGLKPLLKPQEALIDIYRFNSVDAQFNRVDRYGAFITGQHGPTKFVDLGDAAPIDQLESDWINEVSENGKSGAAPWQGLRTRLNVVFNNLPPECTLIWVCPDGELSRLPWQLLAAKPNLTVAQLNSPRELVRLRTEKSGEEDGAPCMVLGGPDFNARISASDREALIKLAPLPGTASEAKAIAELARKQRPTIELYSVNATKENLLESMPKSSYVHLATHGFFFDESAMSKIIRTLEPSTTRSVRLNYRTGTMLSGRNPLVESGLALAGANRCVSNSDSRAGFLTAEEIVGLDLRKSKLITLSACETGRGRQITGQGVLGLRAAIMAAGARSVVMSLWRVSDLPTACLMKDFYANLWQKHMAPAAALQSAQKSMAAQFPNNPNFWAGWIIVGEAW